MLKVHIADTPYKLEKGLMFTESMPQDEGMLFVFPKPNKLSFWGANTFIPLDIAFIDRNHVIREISKIKPHSKEAIRSSVECLFAIEANDGYLEANNVHVGCIVNFERDKDCFSMGLVKFTRGNESVQSQDNVSAISKKLSQTQDGLLETPKVNKPHQVEIGDPIAQPEAQQENAENLPIIGPNDIGQYLEDDFDDQDDQLDQMQDLDSPSYPTETEQPTEQEQPEKQYPAFSNVHDALAWATQNNEAVRIAYTSKKGRQITRDVEPHGQFHSESTHRQVLVTFDETVGNIRAFIIHNISQWAFIGKQFDRKFVVQA